MPQPSGELKGVRAASVRALLLDAAA